jgi:hypothetical protein
VKYLAGVFLMVLGAGLIAGGLYVGVWLCLVGGLMDVVNQIKAGVPDTGVLVWGGVRAFFFTVPTGVGVALGVSSASLGMAALVSED